jgi:hypothetical protein
MAMNRVVRLGDLLVRQGVLGIVLLLPCLLSGQQQKAQNQQGFPHFPSPAFLLLFRRGLQRNYGS